MSWQDPATADQLSELGRLAAALGEDLPVGLHRNEAAQRLDEWRRQLLTERVDLTDHRLTHLRGATRAVETVASPLL